MRYQRLKTPIYPKTQFSFVFHTFLGTNTGLPPLSLSRSTTSLSHFLWPWPTTTPWSSGGLFIQQNITSSLPPVWNSKPDKEPNWLLVISQIFWHLKLGSVYSSLAIYHLSCSSFVFLGIVIVKVCFFPGADFLLNKALVKKMWSGREKEEKEE